MRLVFWQNCLGHLQLPYIEHLMDDASVDEVVVVVPADIPEDRKQLGWGDVQYPLLNRCKILIKPTEVEVEHTLDIRQEDSVHLFSGIRGFAFVFDAFKRSLKYNIRRGLVVEGPFTYAFNCSNGKPLWLHRLRYNIQDRKYLQRIDYVFAIGQEAAIFFKSICKNALVFPFSYCTPYNEYEIKEIDGAPKFLYIGNLCKRKAVDTLLKSFCVYKQKHEGSLSLIGGGKEKEKLIKYVSKTQMKDVDFLGVKSNSKLYLDRMSHDIFILPSRHDGWGAVVNEALQQGMYVICSTECGAKDLLLSNPKCGKVFEVERVKDLLSCLEYCYSHINEIRAEREYRRNWAKKVLSGGVISKYMIDCLQSKDGNILVPWRMVNL